MLKFSQITFAITFAGIFTVHFVHNDCYVITCYNTNYDACIGCYYPLINSYCTNYGNIGCCDDVITSHNTIFIGCYHHTINCCSTNQGFIDFVVVGIIDFVIVEIFDFVFVGIINFVVVGIIDFVVVSTSDGVIAGASAKISSSFARQLLGEHRFGSGPDVGR